MSDKQYVVPDGMIDAVVAQIDRGVVFDSALVRKDLEAAIRWLAENPVLPTSRQICSMLNDPPNNGKLGNDALGWLFCEWVRRMFLAPEPEVPDAVKDLLAPFAADGFPAMLAKSSIIEAYNRGKASK